MAVSSSAPGRRSQSFSQGGTRTAAGWRGVNLGGWLVLERWMAPQLFEDFAPEAQDESSLLRLGGEAARRAVSRFRQEFITEDDFRWLRLVGGVNVVRLPLGFWCLEQHAAGTPYAPTRAFVDRAFDWAESHGLGVVLDLHGAVGSQNGQHHSGESGGQAQWLVGKNRARNLEVLVAWAARWGRRRAFLGLGLGNEVAAPEDSEETDADNTCSDSDLWLRRLLCSNSCVLGESTEDYWCQVLKFYVDAALLCRPHMHRDALLVIDVCWDTSRWSSEELEAVAGPLVLDYHHYECMGDGEALSVAAHCQAAALQEALLEAPRRLPLIVGEFSLALKPDSAGYATDPGWQRRFFERQVSLAAEHGAGWFFWSYKMGREGWEHWSFRECVERGWIPTPPGGRLADGFLKSAAGPADDGSSTADTKGDGGAAGDGLSVDADVDMHPHLDVHVHEESCPGPGRAAAPGYGCFGGLLVSSGPAGAGLAGRAPGLARSVECGQRHGFAGQASARAGAPPCSSSAPLRVEAGGRLGGGARMQSRTGGSLILQTSS